MKWILLRQPKRDKLEAYGPFWSKIEAVDAAVKRWGNDPEVVVVPLDAGLNGTIYIPKKAED